MNGRTVLAIAGIVAISGMVAACAGFDFGDIVQVKTPAGIQQSHGVPAKESLNEAESSYQAWFSKTQIDGAQWKANIEKSDEVAGLLGSLTMSFMTAGEGAIAAGAPWAVPALPLITGIIGAVAIRKPGDTSKTEAEKAAEAKANAAWDEAFRAGADSVKAGLAAAKGVV